MARRRTIAELEDMVRWQADQQEAELRHTSADLRRAINQSIQRFRELISDNGHPYFLTSHSGLMEPGPARDDDGTRFAWGLLDTASFSPEVVRIYGFDIHINTLIQELDAVEFGERNHFQFGQDQRTIPVAFFGYDETKIGIVPPPDKKYEYTIWYLPVLPELSEDDDTFNPGVPGAEEWIILDVMLKLLSRDNYPRLINHVRQERIEVYAEILHRARKHQRTGPPVRIDTRGRKRDRRWRMFRHWWVPSDSG